LFSISESGSIGGIRIIHTRKPVPAGKKSMKIVDVSKVPSGPNPHHVDARKIYESPHALAVMITLKPNESLKRHLTPVDVFFYVLEGTGIVEIGDERATVTKDTLIESPALIPHRWMNESGSVFRVLVVKVPRPTEETKLL
jgi:quercetin dioxygenase-like cupin family protein